MHEEMMARVLDSTNLQRAWKRVKSNKGAPGIDGMRIEDFAEFARLHWPDIRQQLAEGRYQPQPVRRVTIPKPDGGERPLGIPTVIDRVIQQAVAQVLTPIFDPEFSASSFGFRPGRSAHGALRQVQGHLNILLDDLDRELERRGHRFARYADDLMILVRSEPAGRRVMASVSRFLTGSLKLKVNEQKSRVAKIDDCTLLGFTFRGVKLRLSERAFEDFKHHIRRLTGRSWGVSMEYRKRSFYRTLALTLMPSG